MKRKRSVKKSFITIAAILIIGIFGYTNNWFGIFGTDVTYAAGDLVITWDNVDTPEPIFVVENMLPGDMEDRNIIVENQGVVTHVVRIIGEKIDEEKSFASILDFVITENGTPIYGSGSGTGTKTLQDFFDDSSGNGMYLTTLDPGEESTFNLKAIFPPESGNEYQLARVVFNLIIGVEENSPTPTLTPTPSTQPCDICCEDIDVDISGNGAGSVNGVYIVCENFQVIEQTNETIINNEVDINSNTGNNSVNNNTFLRFDIRSRLNKSNLFRTNKIIDSIRNIRNIR